MERLRILMRDTASGYPDIWRWLDEIREKRDWPTWCYLPSVALMAHAQAASHLSGVLPSNEILPPEVSAQLQLLAMVGPWRVTQGIYRYHAELLDALWDTPLTGELPSEVLYRIPEWCVYVETPGRSIRTEKVAGFFACLDYVNEDATHLRIGLDILDGPMKILPLTMRGSLIDSLAELDADSRAYMDSHGADDYTLQARAACQYGSLEVAPFLSTLLYLCSTNAEIDSRGRKPLRPTPVKTKRGPRIFPPDEPTAWEVGYRIGAAIRAARESREKPGKGGDGTHASPRPHIRRAHWHGYWIGAKAKVGVAKETKRELVLKWIPPTPVNVKEELETIPTVHGVTK